MKKIILVLLLALLTSSLSSVLASEKKDAQWEYVLTRGELSYSVDMNSIKVVAGNRILLFWLAIQDENADKITLSAVAVNVKKHEYRLEEVYVYEVSSKKLLFSKNTPSDWKYVNPESPIDLIVDFIFKNSELFKNRPPT